jgi:hypothetical protein
MEMKTTFIYSLSDPLTKEVKYIGKSIDPVFRFFSHLHESKNKKLERNENKCIWIKTLLDQGLRPKLLILEEILYKEGNKREIFWIKFFKEKGNILLNMTEGGNTSVISENCKKALALCKNRGQKKGFKHSEETKKIIKEKRKLQVITSEHKLNISKTMSNKRVFKEITEFGEIIMWDNLVDLAKHHKLSCHTIMRYIKGKIKKQKTKSKFYIITK